MIGNIKTDPLRKVGKFLQKNPQQSRTKEVVVVAGHIQLVVCLNMLTKFAQEVPSLFQNR